MEVDQTLITEEELNYWCKEYPDLDRAEVAEILECIQISDVKEDYWKNNPSLDETVVNKVVASNAAASYEYHLYNTLNDEAQ
tara:strand:+ start:395 stop:640 length:246 start_codon:yes stop_codon:yes gene_type:complete